MFKRSLLVAFSFSILAFSAFASPEQNPGKRLIELRPGVLRWATPQEMSKLSARAHHEGRCGGFMDLTDYPIRPGLRAQRSVPLDGREPRAHAIVQPLLKQADAGNLLGWVARLSSYPDRRWDSENGVKAAHWIRDQFIALSKGRNDVSVELVPHRFKQPSVIATLHGSGPNKNETVIIGGHIDSISSSSHAPGADDNASGTATVLESFRILVQSGFRPNRTIQFMGYAGEERGLLGSQDIATRYLEKGLNVAGVLQLDMTMYPGAQPRITFITDYTNRDLNKYLQRLSDEYVKARWVEDTCGYPCSDHASWTRAGYPASFPFEAPFRSINPDIHTPRDTMKNLDADHGLSYLKLAISFGVELGESATAYRMRSARPRF